MVLIRQWRDECCWSWEHETTQVWCRVEEVVSVLIMLLFKEKSFRTLNKITINEGRSWYQAETLNLGNMVWRWSPHTSNQHKIILIWMIFQEIIKNIFMQLLGLFVDFPRVYHMIIWLWSSLITRRWWWFFLNLLTQATPARLSSLLLWYYQLLVFLIISWPQPGSFTDLIKQRWRERMEKLLPKM